MRLIDADAVINAIKDYGKSTITANRKTLDPVDDIISIVGIVDNIPTVDMEQMTESKICPVCGRPLASGWIRGVGIAYYCGQCGYSADTMNQAAKQDAGKPRLSLVPSQIIWDIAEIRQFGNAKYHDPENWRTVEIERYIDALYRHFLRFLDNPSGKDEESGIEHYKHMACNMAFICEMMAQGKEG